LLSSFFLVRLAWSFWSDHSGRDRVCLSWLTWRLDSVHQSQGCALARFQTSAQRLPMCYPNFGQVLARLGVRYWYRISTIGFGVAVTELVGNLPDFLHVDVLLACWHLNIGGISILLEQIADQSKTGLSSGSGSRVGFNRSVGSRVRSWSFIVWIGGGRGPIGGRRNGWRRLAFEIRDQALWWH